MYKGQNLKKGDTISFWEPISIASDGVQDAKFALDGYEEIPQGEPTLIFLSYNSSGELSVNNAKNSVFPANMNAIKQYKEKISNKQGKNRFYSEPQQNQLIDSNEKDRITIMNGILEEKILEQ